MNYEEKYKQALGWMRSLYKGLHGATKEDAEHYFPELKESEDERIRKELITHCRNTRCVTEEGAERIAKWITWLEKQGEQNQTWEPDAAQLIVIKDLIEDKNTSKVNKVILRGMLDEFKQFTNTNKREIDDAYLQGICDTKHEIEKQGEQTQFDYEHADILQKDFATIEPKFKVGDFITNGYCLGKVIVITNDAYLLDTGQGIPFSCENTHHWTIQDAKDGDVLVDEDNNIGLLKEKDDLCWHSYIYLGCDNCLRGFNLGGYHTNKKTKPATKEQRDLLFEKMKEAGYEWDAEKKEVKKIEHKALNADEVIAWLDKNANLFDAKWCYIENIIEQLKQDFGL